ncbi:MAG: glycosyltransferase family 4 protein, partial [Chloroflexota bacterium]|nr:glycosyltransferase family 4 protein [Chloroflexota bacterium]
MNAPSGEPTDPESLTIALVAPPNSIHTRRWADWFARAGHEVVLVDPTMAELQPGIARGIRVEQPRQLRDALVRLKPDIVHAQYLARFGWRALRAGVRPLVVTPWGSDLLQVPRWRLRTRLWNRLALSSADLVTVSSEGMRSAAVKAGARADRIALVRHGVDTSRFAPGSPHRPNPAQVAGSGAAVVLSPRSVTPLYRHDVVLAAVAQLARRHDPAPVMVVTATAADPATLKALREAAGQLGVGDRLHVLEDVTPDDLPDLYRTADVVASVPETDSFAVTLLEAMATGVPVVASDLPAVAPMLRSIDPRAGQLVVPVGDVAATADAIERALTLGSDARHMLGTAMRSWV